MEFDVIAREECIDGSEDGGEEDGLRDLEDDENEEGNWRNDYPDEDPLYYETIDTEYFSGRGIKYLCAHTHTYTHALSILHFSSHLRFCILLCQVHCSIKYISVGMTLFFENCLIFSLPRMFSL